MALYGCVLPVPALRSVAVPSEQRDMAYGAEHGAARPCIYGFRTVLLLLRRPPPLGSQPRHPLGRAVVPYLWILLPDDGVPSTSEGSVVAVPTPALLPHLCRSSPERTPSVLLFCKYSNTDSLHRFSSAPAMQTEEILT